jgi:hypothetical protein
LSKDFIEVWSEPAGDSLDVNGMILAGSLSKNITVYGHVTRARYFLGNLVEKVNAENKPESEPELASAVVSGLPMVKKYLNMKVDGQP